MIKRIGIDLGTNSIGWAIVGYQDGSYELLDKGVNVFKDGVEHDKSGEHPSVQQRTAARSARKIIARRRKRKIGLLEVLCENGLCPKVPQEALDLWRKKKVYPMLPAFIEWQRTDDNTDKNPYHDRHIALTEKLDLDKESDRYLLGRALYHLNQRRGFISNRKDSTNENEKSAITQSINDLDAKMKEAGFNYLGDYFYHLYQQKGKIRTAYTSRVRHLKEELHAIYERQGLSEDLRQKLDKAILFQRPLKSQKGSVGKCTFEPSKSRCLISHPRYEAFRMWSFINNIKIQTKDDYQLRPLNAEEVEKIMPKFFRKSMPVFDFSDLIKPLVDKNDKVGFKNDSGADVNFNFRPDTTVSGCPVIACLKELFGDNWEQGLMEVYDQQTDKNGKEKTREDVVNDVWHVLATFDDDDKLSDWAKKHLQLTDEQAEKFIKIKMSQTYASLSLRAINKILPYLKKGYRYDEAVFMANLGEAVPKGEVTTETEKEELASKVADIITGYEHNPLDPKDTKEKRISDFLKKNYKADDRHLGRLYHPSMIETYKKAHPNTEGVYQLGSPRTSSVRNPMAMRALFRLRLLMNALLKKGEIDENTIVNIEFARELNDANMRVAIERMNRDKEKQNKEIRDRLAKEYKVKNPTDTDVLKFTLWEEQNHICLYTGKEIGVADFIGEHPRFDIEHTVPRSKGGDDSQMNKTLCESRYNRETKIDKIPSELTDHEAIMQRIETLGWAKKIEDLEKQIQRLKRASKTATTKPVKDAAITRRHQLQMEMDYWKGKMERFTLLCVNEGFTNRQGVDIGIIGKYAKMYLHTVFRKIFTVKGATTHDFRVMWGLQKEGEPKDRSNHKHHCIDAITIACIGRKEYDDWAQYQKDKEAYLNGHGCAPTATLPWDTFTRDVLNVGDDLLIHHFVPNNMGKQTKKKLRIRGVIQYGKDKQPLYQQGHSARGSLHQDTYYGAIERDGGVRYVVRRPIGALTKESEIENIVDDEVRQKVKDFVSENGFAALGKPETTVWMNEEKQIPIKKVRMYAPIEANPIHLKKHRDASTKDYKRDIIVSNDGNYCLALYEGIDGKGKRKRDFKMVKTIDAARLFEVGNAKNLVPKTLKDLPLKYVLTIGKSILFYESDPDELENCDKQDIKKRLYTIRGLSLTSATTGGKRYEYGGISAISNFEARPLSELKEKKGLWSTNEDYRPIITINHNQANILVEGYDFDFSITGEIVLKEK